MTRVPVAAPIDVPAGDKRQVFGWCCPIASVNANGKMQRLGGLPSIVASFCDPGVYHFCDKPLPPVLLLLARDDR